MTTTSANRPTAAPMTLTLNHPYTTHEAVVAALQLLEALQKIQTRPQVHLEYAGLQAAVVVGSTLESVIADLAHSLRVRGGTCRPRVDDLEKAVAAAEEQLRAARAALEAALAAPVPGGIYRDVVTGGLCLCVSFGCETRLVTLAPDANLVSDSSGFGAAGRDGFTYLGRVVGVDADPCAGVLLMLDPVG